jgi:hypothetical protein
VQFLNGWFCGLRSGCGCCTSCLRLCLSVLPSCCCLHVITYLLKKRLDTSFLEVQFMQMGMSKSEVAQKCITDCLDCYRTCAETTAQCLKMGGEHAEAKHITVMNACADACVMSADYMLRDVEFQNEMCNLCSQICDSCAQSCEKFSDDFMKRCAQTCRKCAESCRNMFRQS